MDSKRTQISRHLENAMYQYLVDKWELPNASQIPDGEANAKQICAQGVADATCANIDPLIAPQFIAYVPRDELEPCALYSGYKTFTYSGRPRVIPRFLGKLQGDTYAAEPCGNPEPPLLSPFHIWDDKSFFINFPSSCSIASGIGYANTYTTCSTEMASNLVSQVLQPGNYAVYATWVAAPNLQTNVSYELSRITSAWSFVVSTTVTKDQTIAPNDGQYNGSMFELLATVTLLPGDNGVRIRWMNITGTVFIDAVMLVAL